MTANLTSLLNIVKEIFLCNGLHHGLPDGHRSGSGVGERFIRPLAHKHPALSLHVKATFDDFVVVIVQFFGDFNLRERFRLSADEHVANALILGGIIGMPLF